MVLKLFLLSSLILLGSFQLFTQDIKKAESPKDKYSVSLTNIAKQAGLDFTTVYGDVKNNRYLLETTGTGVAFIDFDNDGWQDIFFVNGTRLDDLPKGVEKPTNRLYRNKGNGTFEDVTAKAGLTRTNWGQGVTSVITTMMVLRIYSLPHSAKTLFIKTTATAHLQISQKKPELRTINQNGVRELLFSIMITTEIWICLLPVILISI